MIKDFKNAQVAISLVMNRLFSDINHQYNLSAMVSREQLTLILQAKGQENKWIDEHLLAHFERIDARQTNPEIGNNFVKQVEDNCGILGEEPV